MTKSIYLVSKNVTFAAQSNNVIKGVVLRKLVSAIFS